jgi:signal transduction histidine kinase
LRFFSLDKGWQKIVSFILEMVFVLIFYKWIKVYLFIYSALLAIDSNVLFKKYISIIFNLIIVLEELYLLRYSGLQNQFLNIAIVTMVIAVLYFTREERDKKLEAQDLYDRLKISEDKLKKANEELEIYAASIEEITSLRERNRISREIHDSVGHHLSTMVIQLGAIEKTISKNAGAAETLTKNLRKFTQQSLNDVRMAVREMKPKEFEVYEGILNIEELINNFKKMTGVDVRLSFTKEKWSLNSDQAFIIYRIIQEFLSNSLRHGGATIVRIMMAFSEKKLVLTLKDNGRGVNNLVEGIGIKSIRERVMEAGGFFEYNSKAGEGFLVKIELNRWEKPKIHSRREGHGEN